MVAGGVEYTNPIASEYALNIPTETRKIAEALISLSLHAENAHADGDYKSAQEFSDVVKMYEHEHDNSLARSKNTGMLESKPKAATAHDASDMDVAPKTETSPEQTPVMGEATSVPNVEISAPP